ncbi:hypothetical protein V7056_19130 [Bacillus sp. JJ664]
MISMILWIILNYLNPYSDVKETGVNISTLFLLFLPACLTIYASLNSKISFMLIAFVWSLPFSFYFALTPGLFAIFGITSLGYLISYFFMRIENNHLSTTSKT